MDFTMFAPMRWISPIIVSCALLFGSEAQAAFVYHLSHEFSGAQQPAGEIVAWFLDKDDVAAIGNDAVIIVLESDLVGTEFLKDKGFYFNFDPAASDGTLATIESTFRLSNNADTFWSSSFDSNASFFQSQGTFSASLDSGVNDFRPDGDGYFDFLVDFGSVFDGSDRAVFVLTGTGLSADDFHFVSVDGPVGKNGFPVASHVQGVGDNGSGSGFVTDDNPDDDEPGPVPGVPEPTSLAAWLLGSAGLGLILRGRMKKAAA